MSTMKERAFQATRVTWVGFFVNLVLMLFKLVAGILGKSQAMIADGVHSASDFATDIVVMVGLAVASKPTDSSHKYGHGKFETLATFLIGGSLLAVAFGILYSSAESVLSVLGGNSIDSPHPIALIAAIVSIIGKEALYQYTVRVGKRINSQAVIANAWHHRSDALSSIGAALGIGGSLVLGRDWAILDPLAGLIVSLFIGKVAVSIAWESIKELLETALPEEREQEILQTVTEIAGVYDPHNMRTRKIGNNMALDLHIRVEKNLTIVEAHNIATDIEKRIREKYGEETLISVHIEPLRD